MTDEPKPQLDKREKHPLPSSSSPQRERATQSNKGPKFGGKMSVERWIALFTLITVLLSSGFNAVEFSLKWPSEKISSSEVALVPMENSLTSSIRAISHFKDNSNLYDVKINISVTNKSHSNIFFSYSILKAYLAPPVNLNLSAQSGIELNAPPDIDPPRGSEKLLQYPVKWQQFSCLSSLGRDEKHAEVLNFINAMCKSTASPNAGLTGNFPPGMANQCTYEFFIRAKPGSFIGIALTYGINGSLDPDSTEVSISNHIDKLE